MKPWLESLVPWGVEVLQFLQQWHHPILDSFFQGITLFGNQVGYLILMPLIYWCLSDRVGRRMGYLVFFSLSLNFLLKAWAAIPRPHNTQLRILIEEKSLSFPSGHAQGTLTLWGYLFTAWKHTWFRIVAVLLILTIGYSRMYLGAHYPQDILGGWLFALLSIGLFLALEPKILPRFQQFPLPAQLLLASLPPLLLFALLPGYHQIPPCAAWLGFSLGLVLEHKYVRFSTDGTTTQRALRFLGVLPVGILLYSLKKILPEGDLWRFLRYALTGWTAAYLIPLLFLKLKLAHPHTEKA